MSKITSSMAGVSQVVAVDFPHTTSGGGGGSNGGTGESLWNDTFNFSSLTPGDSYKLEFNLFQQASDKAFYIKYGTTVLFNSKQDPIPAFVSNQLTAQHGVKIEMKVTKHSDTRCSYSIYMIGYNVQPNQFHYVKNAGNQYCTDFFKTSTDISFVLDSTGSNQVYLRLVEVSTTTKMPEPEVEGAPPAYTP